MRNQACRGFTDQAPTTDRRWFRGGQKRVKLRAVSRSAATWPLGGCAAGRQPEAGCGTGVARSPPPAPCCLRLGTQSGGGSWGSANLVRHPDSARVCVLMAAVALTDGYRERPSRGPICYAVAVATGRPGTGIAWSDCIGLLPADWTGCRQRPKPESTDELALVECRNEE